MAWRKSNSDSTEFDVFFRLLPLCVIVGAIAFMLTRHAPEPLHSTALQGCYAAPGAPPLRFDGSRLHFGGAALPPTSYTLSLSKDGIHVDPAQPVRLRQNHDGSWAFYRPREGWSYRIRLVEVISEKAYGVRSVSDADYIEFAVGDGTLLAFRPASSDMCKQ